MIRTRKFSLTIASDNQHAPNSPMMNIMIDLLYDKFAAHTQASSLVPTIPNTIPIDLHHAMTQVWTDLIALKPTTMAVLNPRVMAANPGFLTYSFSILPTPSTHRKFIALLPENIKTRSGYQGAINRGDGPTFLASYQIFNDVFQFRKFGSESPYDIISPTLRHLIF
ncbi:hypothetical protein BC941DRAFT_476770 [Chlamydoabsidia padenii]|nr:hypothetical protein BC941DRAFT_476770 [Chlamydoabsidia padenii]